MVTVRLDTETETTLRRLAAQRGQSKSDVIRDAIVRLAEIEEAGADGSAYARLRPFVGIDDSGGRQLSRRTGRRFREHLEAEADARRSG